MICLVPAALLYPLSSVSILRIAELPRGDYPLPDFVRVDYVCLEDPREFRFDDSDVCFREQWQNGSGEQKRKAVVPCPFHGRFMRDRRSLR